MNTIRVPKRFHPDQDWHFVQPDPSLNYLQKVSHWQQSDTKCMPLVKSAYQKNNFYFSTKTYVVGTQKNRLHETFFFEHPKHMLKIMGKEIFTILRRIFFFI